MNRCLFSPRTPGRAGFTLIELLTVIAIILVLAGLLLYVAGSVNYKGSLARAQAEVKAMEAALESYKADNGTYPRNDNTDTCAALSGTTPADPTADAQKDAGRYLYQCLSGLNADGTYGKKYMDFKPAQLSTGSAMPTATGTYIVDPFGLPYGYSTIYQTDSTKGYNPTFDLWSTAGYGSGGKSYPSGASTGAAAVALWVKNW